MILRFLTITALSVSLSMAADRNTDHNAHAWFAYFGDHPVGESKWGVHLEAQIRRHDFGRTWQQFLFRPGVNYQASKRLMLTVGYTLARSHSYTDWAATRPAFNEHRIWYQ